MGFFGWKPATENDEGKRIPAQPLYMVRVDIKVALAATEELMELWLDTQKQPSAPAFSGGVLDAWPAYAVDALAIARDETTVIRAFLVNERG